MGKETGICIGKSEVLTAQQQQPQQQLDLRGRNLLEAQCGR
jgi:hypothetical protein